MMKKLFFDFSPWKAALMHDDLLLSQLEAAADRLGITIRYEDLPPEGPSSSGGLCRIEGKYVVILDPRARTREKIQIMIETLKKFPLDDIYLKPALRDLLEDSKE
jgi:hypothetical protein